MQASILIVSRNRKTELEYTLKVLRGIIDISIYEILVFLDGCSDSSRELKLSFPEVRWFESGKSLGASPARNALYKKAKGTVLIGLDDDAHPLYADFIARTITVFKQYPNVGVIAFQEIKGVFRSDEEALESVGVEKVEYVTNEFIGCGFAIRKDVYVATNGFPVWMDIYGEESCVAIEVISKGYDILFSNAIKVHHRVDKESRKSLGKNYFRFERQLKNTTFYYLVYHPSPILKIIKLYWHNFKTYALKDFIYFKLFWSVVFQVLKGFPLILKYRRPIGKLVFNKVSSLERLQF